MNGLPSYHTLVVLVENRPGVLARVTGLFARREFNIHSLAVAPTEDPQLSRITIVADTESTPVEQVVNQLDKLINVVKINELAPEESVEQELLMATVGTGEATTRSQVLELCQIFGAKVLNTGASEIMVRLAGAPGKLDDFEELLRPIGIVAIQRTGRVALPRLDRTPSAGSLRAVV